jgi:hypothetical protein
MKKVDKTYFKGIVNIPDIDSFYSEIDDFIDLYSKEILVKILGLKLYKQLIAADFSDETSELHKLYYGSDFEVQDEQFRWNGFINDERISILSDYVFLMYSRDNYLMNNNIGVTVPMPENSTITDTAQRQSEVYARMEKMIIQLYDYIYYSDSEIYDNFKYPYEFKNPNEWLF